MTAPRRVLVVSGLHSEKHQTPAGHPEAMARLDAVLRGVAAVEGPELVVGRLATTDELELVHPRDHVAWIRSYCESGGGWLDPDTFASEGTYVASSGAVGAGLAALDALTADPHIDAALVAARPPGHHATGDRAMGFCFFNAVAVAAARLRRANARVVIVDWDAHHGNGTQDIFWADDQVLYVSLHQEMIFPGTGHAHERGPAASNLSTVNLPLPAGATGDHYLALLDRVAGPIVDRFRPDWVLVSCGFDAHAADPLADMALGATDFGLLAARVRQWAPGPGRTVLFFEGGYDLTAVEESTRAVMSSLTGAHEIVSKPSAGGPGALRVNELERFWTPS